MIDDIWQGENVEAASVAAQRSRLEGLAAAAAGVCVCRGDWPSFVVNNFLLNGIPLGELCYDVLQALAKGRSEVTPVLVLARRSGGERKSDFLKPLHCIYDGFVFFLTTGRDAGNFPLVDLPGAKVAFLDEYRFDQSIVS